MTSVNVESINGAAESGVTAPTAISPAKRGVHFGFCFFLVIEICARAATVPLSDENMARVLDRINGVVDARQKAVNAMDVKKFEGASNGRVSVRAFIVDSGTIGGSKTPGGKPPTEFVVFRVLGPTPGGMPGEKIYSGGQSTKRRLAGEIGADGQTVTFHYGVLDTNVADYAHWKKEKIAVVDKLNGRASEVVSPGDVMRMTFDRKVIPADVPLPRPFSIYDLSITMTTYVTSSKATLSADQTPVLDVTKKIKSATCVRMPTEAELSLVQSENVDLLNIPIPPLATICANSQYSHVHLNSESVKKVYSVDSFTLPLKASKEEALKVFGVGPGCLVLRSEDQRSPNAAKNVPPSAYYWAKHETYETDKNAMLRIKGEIMQYENPAALFEMPQGTPTAPSYTFELPIYGTQLRFAKITDVDLWMAMGAMFFNGVSMNVETNVELYETCESPCNNPQLSSGALPHLVLSAKSVVTDFVGQLFAIGVELTQSGVKALVDNQSLMMAKKPHNVFSDATERTYFCVNECTPEALKALLAPAKRFKYRFIALPCKQITSKAVVSSLNKLREYITSRMALAAVADRELKAAERNLEDGNAQLAALEAAEPRDEQKIDEVKKAIEAATKDIGPIKQKSADANKVANVAGGEVLLVPGWDKENPKAQLRNLWKPKDDGQPPADQPTIGDDHPLLLERESLLKDGEVFVIYAVDISARRNVEELARVNCDELTQMFRANQQATKHTKLQKIAKQKEEAQLLLQQQPTAESPARKQIAAPPTTGPQIVEEPSSAGPVNGHVSTKPRIVESGREGSPVVVEQVLGKRTADQAQDAEGESFSHEDRLLKLMKMQTVE